MKKIIQIYSRTPNVSGVQVILMNLRNVLELNNFIVNVISNKKHLCKTLEVIPYGIKEAIEMLFLGFNVKVVFLVDAYSLGCKNYFIYFAKNKIVNRQTFRMLLSWFFYLFAEFLIIRKYPLVILVSINDKRYFEKLFKRELSNIFVVNNGIIVNTGIKKKDITKKKVSIGVIAHWTEMSFYDIAWFLNSYLEELNLYLEFEIIIAGRGATSEMINFFKSFNNVRHLGEVKNLSEFYDSIDYYLVTVIKECGILNKVIEAFSKEKLVFGMKRHFLPFDKLVDGYVVYDSPKDLAQKINFYTNNEAEKEIIVQNALNYVLRFHNWELNYNSFWNEYEKK